MVTHGPAAPRSHFFLLPFAGGSPLSFSLSFFLSFCVFVSLFFCLFIYLFIYLFCCIDSFFSLLSFFHYFVRSSLSFFSLSRPLCLTLSNLRSRTFSLALTVLAVHVVYRSKPHLARTEVKALAHHGALSNLLCQICFVDRRSFWDREMILAPPSPLPNVRSAPPSHWPLDKICS